MAPSGTSLEVTKDSKEKEQNGPLSNLDPSTFILREATLREKTSCWLSNSASWAGKLTIDEYIGRESVNGSGELTCNGGIRYWVFVAPPLSNASAATSTIASTATAITESATDGKDEVIYASVETLKKVVAIRTRDGGFSIESSWAIASVFTPLQYRGRKIAAWMMRRLGEWLDSDQAGCRVSVLFSDVGEYYSHLGWKTFPNLETSLPSARTSCSDTVPLTVDTLRTLCEADVSAVVSNVSSAPLLADTYARLAFLPTYPQAAWHFGAEEYIASKISKLSPRTPSIKGAICSSGHTWGYWVHDYDEDKLVLLRLVSSYSQSSTSKRVEEAINEIAAVLRAAQNEAAKWFLHKVVIWNPEPLTLEACRLVSGNGQEPQVRRRTEGSIPCLRWKGRNGDEELGQGIRWVALEKYCWC